MSPLAPRTDPTAVPAVAARQDPVDQTVSIVLAVHDPPLDALRAQLVAIAAQTSGKWECVVVDDASTNRDVRSMVQAWVDVDPRRRLVSRAVNGGIAAATNDGLELVTGEFVTICDHDDLIDESAVAAILEHFNAHPRHDVVYTDEQVIDADGRTIAEYRKPDYSPRRHLGHHYLAHLVAARRTAIGDLRIRREFEPSQDFDFYLRVIEDATRRGQGVGHIARILYSWRALEGSSALDASEKPEMAAAVARCAQAALVRRRFDATATTVMYRGSPTTSVLLVADSTPGAALDFIELGVATTPTDVNRAIESSNADIVCLVPDRARVDADWAAPLVADVLRADVGVVGVKLVAGASSGDEMMSLLSVGRTVGETLSEPFAGVDHDDPGPWGSFFVAREVSAVAPEGMAVERSKFMEAGGLATDVGLDVAVAELCTALAVAGRATIWNPAAELTVDLPDGASSLLDARFRGSIGRRSLDDQMAVAAARQPELRTEHFATSGTSAFVNSGPNVFTVAHDAIVGGTVELVTSDVFDTVVTRPVATPSDMFVELGRRLAADELIPAHVTPAVFSEARREAERRARDRRRNNTLAELRGGESSTDVEIAQHPEVAAPECTLTEIWSEMPWSLDVDADRFTERELDLEGEYLRPIPETTELFRAASEHGIPVVLVSDIYMSADQLRRVLDRAGVDLDLVDGIVTSADHRCGKAHGLLASVIETHGVAAEKTLHVGDNDISDIATAGDLGALVAHVDVPGPMRHIPIPHPALATWSRLNGTDLGISAAVRATLIGAGPLAVDPSYQFGVSTVGPALAGFSRWVAVRARQLGAGTVHCMLREGATIAELMAITSPALDTSNKGVSGPATVPLHVSRWVTMRASVLDADRDELFTALARRADLTVSHVVDAFGCDPDLVRSVLGADRIDARELVSACERLAADDEIRAQIVASAADLRKRTLRYLRSRLVIDDGPIVVADVGWGGTIQEGLTRILRSDGIDNEVIGLYFAMSGAGEQRIRRGAHMLSYLPNEFDDPETAKRSRSIAHHADTIERVMTPELGTLVDISPEGEPVTRPVDDDRIPPTLQAAQNAMRAVVRRLADSGSDADSDTGSDLGDPRWTEDRDLTAVFACTIADVVTSPTPTIASALGDWPHDDVAGTDHRTIAVQGLADIVRYSTARDVDVLDPAGRKWIAGLAAQHNPVLAAQLEAGHSGAALEALAPLIETGAARLRVFSIGSELVAAQATHVPSILPAGWSIIHFVGDVDSLRSVRFDPSEHGAIVEICEFTIGLRTDREFDPPPLVIEDLHDDRITWVGAHRVGSRRFVHDPGGHLVVSIDPDLGARCRSVEVTVAFRAWHVDPDDLLLREPIEQRFATERRRLARVVRRRLQR